MRFLLAIATVAFCGPAADAQFLGRPGPSDGVGSAVASGDFDGDGYADLAAGAPGEYVGAVPHGTVHVVYGTPDGLSNLRQQVWNIETLGTSDEERTVGMGYVLASGDFNGDGRDDLALSGRGVNPFGPKGGAVYVVYGSPDGLDRVSGSQIWHMDRNDLCFDTGRAGCASSVLNDNFGYTLAAGDFNNDSFDELAVGIPGLAIDDATMAGAVLVLQGSGMGLVTDDHRFFSQDDPEAIIGGSETNDWFGSGLEAGDINGDGFDDLAVGSILEDIESAGADFAGSVNLLFGSGTGLSEFANQFLLARNPGEDPEESDNFGSSIGFGHFSSAPSAQPRYGDLVIGMPGRDTPTGGPDAGAASYFTGSDLGASAAAKPYWDGDTDGLLSEELANELFGAVVESGDFDGDGYDDLAVSKTGYNGGNPTRGAFHVIRGGSGGLTATGAQFWESDSLNLEAVSCSPGGGLCGGVAPVDELFGRSLAAGDFNMDGYLDLAVGAPNKARLNGFENVPPYELYEGAGAVFVIYGSDSGLGRDGAQLWFQNLPATEPELITPADDSEILIGGIETPSSDQTPLAVVWSTASDPDSNIVTYAWQISSGPSFDDTLASFDAGEVNQLIVTHGELGAIMTANGVEFEQTVTWFHRVVAHDGVEATPGPVFSVVLTRGTFVASEHADELPAAAAIIGAFPNPATGSATVRFRTTSPDAVTITLFDVRGVVTRRIRSDPTSTGKRSLRIDLTSLPGGIYIYRMSGGGLSDSGKLVVLP